MSQQAFHNKESLKQEIISRMKEHIELGQLVQGEGYDKFSGKGCAVGCSINCYDHQSFADTLGVDIWIAQIYDSIHEDINVKHIAKFNIDFLNSIPIGMTIQQSDMVRLKLFYFILTRTIPPKFQKYKKIVAIINLFKQSIEGVIITKEQWEKVTDNIPKKYQFVATYAYASAYASASAYVSAYAYVSKQKVMLKISNKLIELFNEIK